MLRALLLLLFVCSPLAAPAAAQRRADTGFDVPSAAWSSRVRPASPDPFPPRPAVSERPGRGAVTGIVVGGLAGALGTALYYGDFGAPFFVGGLAGGCIGYVVGSVVDSVRGPAPPPPLGYPAAAPR
ncbi:MAG: hypothetical protein AB1941_08920 [Gemmatimonadota bacterium]